MQDCVIFRCAKIFQNYFVLQGKNSSKPLLPWHEGELKPMLINYSFKDPLLPDPLCQLLSFCCRHRSAEQEKAGLGQRFGRRGVGWDAIQGTGPSDAHRDKEAALITQKHRHAVMCMKTTSTVSKPADISNDTLDSHSKSSSTNLKSVYTKCVMLCWRILCNFGSLEKTRPSKWRELLPQNPDPDGSKHNSTAPKWPSAGKPRSAQTQRWISRSAIQLKSLIVWSHNPIHFSL